MFALLGLARLPLQTIGGKETTHAVNYAEHALIGGKPQLQRTGAALDEHTLSLTWHRLYCEPEIELQRLKLLLDSRIPAPLVLASGTYLGEFVVTEFSVSHQETTRLGFITSATARVKLKEAPRKGVLAEQPATKKQAPAKRKGKTKPAAARELTPPARKPGEPLCRFVDE